MIDINIILAVVQILTLIALIIYVKKTWDMAVSTEHAARISESTLQEMRDARDQEVAPYVVVYFEIVYGQNLINLVIRNVGKSIAEDVKIEFNPELVNSHKEDINNHSFIKEGIGSIPPGYEIKTFFDISHSYFQNEKLPLKYDAKITYKGGIKAELRTSNQVLDLYAYRDLTFINEKGLDELVKEIENITKYEKEMSYNIEKIRDRLDSGVWIKNSDFLISELETNTESWKRVIIVILSQFKILWDSIYNRNKDQLLNPHIVDFKNKINMISSQILLLSAKNSHLLSEDIYNNLNEISARLLGLSMFRFGLGKNSVNDFNNSGDQIIKLIDDTIEKINFFED